MFGDIRDQTCRVLENVRLILEVIAPQLRACRQETTVFMTTLREFQA